MSAKITFVPVGDGDDVPDHIIGGRRPAAPA